MKTSHIVTLNIFITLLLLGGFYYAINQYGTEFLTGVWDKNGVTKVINQKVINQNVSEYRKLSDMQSDITKAIDTVSPAVMHIVRSSDVNGTSGIISSINGGGTAIAVTSDGYLITNKHVIENIKDKYVAVTAEGEKFPVSNIWVDPILDLAVLKVTNSTGKALNDLPTATFVSKDSSIHLGQFAILVGNSQNSLAQLQTIGSVSQKNITFNVTSGDASVNIPYIALDAVAYPGFSGGPTIDLAGNVIAITTAIQNLDQAFTLSLPITNELVQETLRSITEQGKIIRHTFGMSAVSLNAYRAQQLGLKKFNGLYVQKVNANSPAATAGLQKGDVIMQIDNKDVTDSFAPYWLSYGSGDTIEFTIYRADATKKLSLLVQ